MPPSLPAQLQSHSSLLPPVTAEAVPVLHKPVVGGLVTLVPLTEPHTPLTGVVTGLTAKHPAMVPPVLAVQFQIHEEVPSAVTAEAVLPVAHRFVAGALLMVWPLADPHAPSVTVVPLDELPDELLLDEPLLDELLDELDAARLAPQSTAVPPPVPWQIQVQGPEPDTGDAVPRLQRLEVGAALTVVLLAEPQMPLTGSMPAAMPCIAPCCRRPIPRSSR